MNSDNQQVESIRTYRAKLSPESFCGTDREGDTRVRVGVRVRGGTEPVRRPVLVHVLLHSILSRSERDGNRTGRGTKKDSQIGIGLPIPGSPPTVASAPKPDSRRA